MTVHHGSRSLKQLLTLGLEVRKLRWMLGLGEIETFSYPHLPTRFEAHQDYMRCMPSPQNIKGTKQGGGVCLYQLLFLLLTGTTYRGKGGRVCLGSQLKSPVLPSREGLVADAGDSWSHPQLEERRDGCWCRSPLDDTPRGLFPW